MDAPSAFSFFNPTTVSRRPSCERGFVAAPVNHYECIRSPLPSDRDPPNHPARDAILPFGLLAATRAHQRRDTTRRWRNWQTH